MKRPSATRWLAESVWLAAALIVVCGFQLDGYAQGRGIRLGQKAPDFNITGIYGEPYSLETFKGHILVMQFGSSW
jgi:cytochrome oxidase Cu insertion factor (SCO1/SenC/PrrC family)